MITDTIVGLVILLVGATFVFVAASALLFVGDLVWHYGWGAVLWAPREGIAVVCTCDQGTFPFAALFPDSESGGLWHDGSEWNGDIVCHGPFRLFASTLAPRKERSCDYGDPDRPWRCVLAAGHSELHRMAGPHAPWTAVQIDKDEFWWAPYEISCGEGESAYTTDADLAARIVAALNNTPDARTGRTE